MKQHITVEQVKELRQEVIAKIGESLYSAMYFYSKLEHEPRWDFAANLLTIGKMIEILDVKSNYVSMQTVLDNADTDCWIVEFNDFEWQRKELCDALWEAVKYVLAEGSVKE